MPFYSSITWYIIMHIDRNDSDTVCHIFYVSFYYAVAPNGYILFHFSTCSNSTGNNGCHPHCPFSHWEMSCIEKPDSFYRALALNVHSMWTLSLPPGVVEWKSVAFMIDTFYTFQSVLITVILLHAVLQYCRCTPNVMRIHHWKCWPINWLSSGYGLVMTWFSHQIDSTHLYVSVHHAVCQVKSSFQ